MRRAWLAAVLGACALTSRAPPVELRYFSPPPAPASAPATPRAPNTCPRLRLERVAAASYLGYRIARRISGVELRLYDTLRWTERPSDYVARALAHALFEERGFERALGVPAQVLVVELTAFDELVEATRHAGRVELHYRLARDRDVVDEGMIAVERAAAGPAIEDVVVAIARALSVACAELGDRLVARHCT